MIFSSLSFLILFAPIFFAFYFLSERFSPEIRLTLIAAASVCFYLAGDQSSLVYIAVALSLSYIFGALVRSAANDQRRMFLFTAGIVTAVAPLVFFKYWGMIGGKGSDGGFSLAMPLAISYVVFQQIIFLSEAFRDGGKPSPRPLDYLAGMLFFPRLVAGPLSGVGSVIDEIRRTRLPDDRARDVAIGIGYFCFGLAKKVLIADQLRPSVDAVFNGALTGSVPFLDAWAGLVTFFVMLYFDFSGYSDMAIGLARICGVRLPFNFNSPLKATSLIDFWARWHMSLMKFLLSFIYTPLSLWRMRSAIQARRSRSRVFLETAALPAMLTMLLSGIWHGGGWNFVIFGILHGAILTLNQFWRQWRLPKLGIMFGWSSTFGFLLLTLILFRAPSPADAWVYLEALFGGQEIRIPRFLFNYAPPSLHGLVTAASPGETFRYFQGGTQTFLASLLLLVGALILPNSQQIMGEQEIPKRLRFLGYRPSAIWSCVFAALVLFSLANISPSQKAFVYMGF